MTRRQNPSAPMAAVRKNVLKGDMWKIYINCKIETRRLYVGQCRSPHIQGFWLADVWNWHQQPGRIFHQHFWGRGVVDFRDNWVIWKDNQVQVIILNNSACKELYHIITVIPVLIETNYIGPWGHNVYSCTLGLLYEDKTQTGCYNKPHEIQYWATP